MAGIKSRYKKAAVTGGAGFIGSEVCQQLAEAGVGVVTIDNLSTGKRANVPGGVELLEMDVADRRGLAEALRGADIVFHLAAQPSTRYSIREPLLDFESNVLGTFNMLAAAREAGVARFIYTSSSAAYGEPKRLPMSEDDLPSPPTPYGASKLCGEHYCAVFNRLYGLRCTWLRPFNVYGPGENPETSLDEVYHYTLAMVRGEPVVVTGDGSQTRDFVHVEDVARAHLLAAEHDASIGEVLNIGSGRGTSINDLIAEIARVAGAEPVVKHQPWPEGDIRHEYGDILRAGRVIGYRPRVALSQGIAGLARLPRLRSVQDFSSIPSPASRNLP